MSVRLFPKRISWGQKSLPRVGSAFWWQPRHSRSRERALLSLFNFTIAGKFMQSVSGAILCWYWNLASQPSNMWLSRDPSGFQLQFGSIWSNQHTLQPQGLWTSLQYTNKPSQCHRSPLLYVSIYSFYWFCSSRELWLIHRKQKGGCGKEKDYRWVKGGGERKA